MAVGGSWHVTLYKDGEAQRRAEYGGSGAQRSHYGLGGVAVSGLRKVIMGGRA